MNGAREAGYISGLSRLDIWTAATNPDEVARLERYYMAQGIVPPSVLRLDEIRPLVVIDCKTAEEAERVLKREGLTKVRDLGSGLLVARPGF